MKWIKTSMLGIQRHQWRFESDGSENGPKAKSGEKCDRKNIDGGNIKGFTSCGTNPHIMANGFDPPSGIFNGKISK